jgi:molecular chaperone HscB
MTDSTQASAPTAPVDFAADHFALFGLSKRFRLDRTALDSAWRDLQTRVHPDRFAAGSDAEKRVALQWASRVNEAYRVLRSPLQRARYLCEIAGHDVQAESNTAMAPAFLMQQMEWREALEEARATGSQDAFDALSAQLDEAREDMVDALTKLLDSDPPDVGTAVLRVREWMFIERLGEELQAAQH